MRHLMSAKRGVLASSAAVLLFVTGALTSGGSARASGVVPGFVVSCAYSHRALVDPIVMPGMVGMSHSHDFFGNSKTNEDSTSTSLRTSGISSCLATRDKSAYWAPTLSEGGKALTPIRMRVYYRAGTKSPSSVKTVPAGLVMIAGNAKATTGQSTSVVSWGCGKLSRGTAAVPTCASKTLVLHVYFPDCWDGVHLNSTDHKSHLAYTHNGACPAGHSVALPKITEDIHYPTRGGSDIAYSFSGNARTAHADFMNAWDQTTLSNLVRTCIVGRRACGDVTN